MGMAQADEVAVEGRMVNVTRGGEGVEGAVVSLHRQSGEAAGQTTVETTTDSQGRFRFDGVPYDPAAAYGLSTTYQGAIYVFRPRHVVRGAEVSPDGGVRRVGR